MEQVEQIKILKEKLKTAMIIVEAAYWDEWSTKNYRGDGIYENKAQNAAGRIFGWKSSKVFIDFKKSVEEVLK